MIFMEIGVVSPIADYKPLRAFTCEGKKYALFRSLDDRVKMWEYSQGVWTISDDPTHIISCGSDIPIEDVSHWLDLERSRSPGLMKVIARWFFKLAYKKELALLKDFGAEGVLYQSDQPRQVNYKYGANQGVYETLKLLELPTYLSDIL